MMRRFACVGDALKDGGKILPYVGRTCTFGNAGHQAALIGGQAYCEACKCTGTIAKAGGPCRMNFMGEVALDGDIVLCKYPTPQRIVATLAGNARYDDGAESAAAVSLASIARCAHQIRPRTRSQSASTSVRCGRAILGSIRNC